MQMKCVSVILFLTMLTLCSCGPESMFHKGIDAAGQFIPGPAAVSNVLKSALHQVVHKAGKIETGCMFNKDIGSMCETKCQKESSQKGFCHGTKCKCGKPLSYRRRK